MKYLFALLLLLSIVYQSKGATITAVSNGAWDNPNTWSPAQLPTDGDDIVIPNGITVNIPSGTDIDLSGGPITTITIQNGGTLFFNVFSILYLSANDAVSIASGGVVHFEPFAGFVFFPTFNTYPPIEDIGDPTTINGPASIENGAMPITLLYFEAEQSQNEILLEWSTASEENFDYFLIERSADGKKYEWLAEIKGAGWSRKILSYHYIDNFPLNGVSYYRLKAVDIDGTSEYFQAVMVQVNGNDNISVLTNPIQNDQVKFQLSIPPQDRIYVQITDVSGVEAFSGSLEAGLSRYKIEKIFDEGIYLLKVATSRKIYTTRFMKK